MDHEDDDDDDDDDTHFGGVPFGLLGMFVPGCSLPLDSRVFIRVMDI